MNVAQEARAKPDVDLSFGEPDGRRAYNAHDRGDQMSSDFDNDGFDDLAIGVRGESIGGIAPAGAAIGGIALASGSLFPVARAGAANVIYGSLAGLAATGNQLWHQDVAGVESAAESDDVFGSPLASGDFNSDGFDDLAIGVLGEDVGTVANAGAVNVLRGSAAGLTAAGDQFWHQDVAGVESAAESDDVFGSALAVGDFDSDGFDDLAIGVRGEDVGAIASGGAVNLLRGSAAGLTATGAQIWHQNSAAVEGGAESGDLFGDALAVGDFDSDGFDDLAIGLRGEDVGTAANAGAVNLLRGAAAGLTAAGDQIWTQDSANVESAAEGDDGFGDALAVGDFDDDGFDDLAIGVAGEDVGVIENAGAVNVLHGSAAGLTATGDQIWHQDVAGVESAAEASDSFGSALAAADFNSDGFDDLAIGVRGEGVGAVSNAGAVNVLYGSAAGLTATGDQVWHQDVAGVESTAEASDLFGDFLSVGDFNDDGFDDLAIGVPGEDVGAVTDAGAANVLLGSASGLTFAGDQIWHQDSSGILDRAESGDLLGGWLA
jgi:FG-GAP repeat protein